MKVLNQFETFEEFPDAILKIDQSSDCYYVESDDKKYIAWENTDAVENLDSNGNIIKYTNGYYSVIDGNKVATTTTIFDGKEYKKQNKEIKVYPLTKILNIKGNSVYELTKEDVIEFSNFKEEKSEDPRKTYF